MNVRNRFLVSLTLFTILFALPMGVLACACCADPGEYRISFNKPSEYELGVIDRIQFGKTAHVYTTEAGIEETARGITDPSENYTMTSSNTGNVWRLTFRDGNKFGTLTLTMPAKMLNFKTDTHDDPSNQHVSLYKEWRFEGRLNGTGIFRNSMSPKTRYFLVFQGRGNNCDSETDFSHWRLEIKGPKVGYALYGEMETETIVTKHATGTFEVKMEPQPAEEKIGDATIGRMALDKEFHGALEGTSKGQMLAAMSDVQGSGAYVAIERVNGTLDGRKGTFALHHRGVMTRGTPQLSVFVIPDSGTGDLVGLEGTMTIEIADGKHLYDFEYTIVKHD